MYVNLPKPCLVGIALTISTHSGPQVVYHYPPIDEVSSSWRNTGRSKTGQRPKDKHPREELASRSSNLTHRSISQRFHYNSDNEVDNTNNSDTNEGDYGEGSSSSNEDTTSGLSDTEMSTDDADLSSSSSSVLDDEMSSLGDNDQSAASLLGASHGENGLHSRESWGRDNMRNSQVSASKLFQFLSGEDSKRNSIVSKLTPRKENVSWGNTNGPDLIGGNEPNKFTLDETYFGSEFQEINKIFHFDSEFFAEICCPPKEMCNTRFELSIDDLCLVGLPIHINENGEWRKSKKTKQSNRSKRSNSTSMGRKMSVASSHKSHRSEQNISEEDDADDEHSINGGHVDDGSIMDSNVEKDEYKDLESSINMFHVCFLMDPHIVEYNERVDDMYHFVISRLSLILRHTQSKTSYVTRECVRILKTKDKVMKSSEKYKAIRGSANKGKYLYQSILNQSSLARALTKCFDSLIKNEVVNLEIDGDKIISLQIPIKNEFSRLPEIKTNPVLRGSFLTSILNRRYLEEDSVSDTGNWSGSVDENDDLLDYALLLLGEPVIIIQELQESSFNDDISNVILITLVKHLKPTIPLRSYQYLVDDIIGSSIQGEEDKSKRNSFQTSMLRSFALHLMYWRHARVIIPISSKNVYIVSPLAPIRGTATDDFENHDSQFLEGKALIYQNQEIFSKKFPTLPPLPSFLSLISTAKPRMFGHIIPSRDHKSIYLSALSWLIRYGYLTQLLTFGWVRVDSRIKIAVDEDLEKDGVRRQNQKQPQKSLANGLNDNIVSKDATLSEQDEDEQGSYYGSEEDLIDNADYTIILEPERATAIEKRWLYKCVEGQPSDIQVLFHKLVKYFNGRTPMEIVMMREGVSKPEFNKLCLALGKYYVQINHW